MTPPIFVSDSDFVAMTKDGALCNAQGHLGPVEFENMMREQVQSMPAWLESGGGCALVYS